MLPRRGAHVGLLLALLGAGCVSERGTVVLDVRLGAGASAPQVLYVSAYDPFGPLVREQAIAAPRLPGTLVVGARPGVALRVVVRGEGGGPPSLGAVELVPRAGEPLRAVVVLTPDAADRDGDGVPDFVDRCPDVADPEQRDADGDGRSDACAAAGADLAIAPADLGSPDLSGFVPQSTCPAGGVLLCDGFESPTLAARWGRTQVNGNVATTQSRSARGQRSYRAHLNAVGASTEGVAEVAQNDTFPPPNDMFIRVFVYVPSPAPSADFDLMSVEEGGSPFGGVSLRLEGGRLATDNTITALPVKRTMSTAFPTDRWVCLEWELKLGLPGQVNVWLDGVAASELSAPQITGGAMLEHLAVGIYLPPAAAPVPAFDVFFDELIFDSAPIGCAK